MKESLQPGVQFTFRFPVPENRTVPHLLPESPEFQAMPEVLASGFMVGLIEWACIQAINPHLNWPEEQTVGIGFQLSHVAATPPGLTVTVEVELTKVEGRKLTFAIRAADDLDPAFPYWIAFDAHTPEGRRTYRDISRDLFLGPIDLQWVGFYFEGGATNEMAPSPWWDRYCRWRFSKFDLPVWIRLPVAVSISFSLSTFTPGPSSW